MQPSSHEPGHHSILDTQSTAPVQSNTQELSPQNLPTLPQQMMPPNTKQNRHLPVVAIAIALLVCVLIICVAVVVFIQGKNKSTTDVPADQGTTQQATSGRLSGQDVNSVKQELTKNINNMDDSKDFTPDDLSNQTLGL